MCNRPESAASLQTETNDVAGPASVQQVNEVSVLGDSDWFTATARNSVHQREPVPMHAEYGDAATAGVYRQQERAVFDQCERSLRCQRIGDAAASSATRCEAALLL